VVSVATLRPGLADAAARTEAQLADAAPHLVDGYRAALPAAADVVGRRLLGALVREDIVPVRKGPGRQHAFNRYEFDSAGTGDPATLLPADGTEGLAVEITNATVNLAVAYARRVAADAALRERAQAAGATDMLGAVAGAVPDEHALALERLAVDGHNLHPCGRTRLGWQVPDLLQHDLETDGTRIDFVAVRQDLLVGDDVGAVLGQAYPDLPPPPPGYVLQPVHTWQLGTVVRNRYADLLRDGALRPVAADLPARPTTALRTLLLPPAADGRHRYLKVSLDILVTSTRRSISVATAHNGPAVSAVLQRLLAEEERVLLLAEVAGAAVPVQAGRDRDLAAIVRTGLDGQLAAGEVLVPGGALPARSPVSGQTVLAELVDRYAATTGRPDRAQAALEFVDEYARLLLPPMLRLVTRYGVGLEAHLQNCLPTFVAGRPHRLALRDFAGLRLHLPRLAAAGMDLPLWPGSVIATTDETALLSKVEYTAFQAHLGELVIRLVESHGLDEAAAWRRIRSIVDEVYADLASGRGSGAGGKSGHGSGAGHNSDDHAFFTAPTVPHKALVRMRLAGHGDLYVPVDNPLHAA
jgi:siderophore synthetase component